MTHAEQLQLLYDLLRATTREQLNVIEAAALRDEDLPVWFDALLLELKLHAKSDGEFTAREHYWIANASFDARKNALRKTLFPSLT